MELEHQCVVVTAICILLVTLMTGPLVPSINGTASVDNQRSLYTSFGEDSERVSVDRQLFVSPTRVSAADLSLEKTRANSHRLESLDALLYVETGPKPVAVTYRISIPELDYDERTTGSVAANAERSISLSIPDESIDRPVANSSVNATVTVTAESDDLAFTVTEETVELEVPE